MEKRHCKNVQRIIFCRGLAAVMLLAGALNLPAQGTAISYQGRLSDSGSLANTNYDFRFAVFTAPTNGSLVSLWLTNDAVAVSNGLFNVALDFGAGVFNGTANGSNDWLDIAVRATGTATFTPLTPRQAILPVPYALFATSASNLLGTLQATRLQGTVSSSVISGTYSNGVSFVNGTNTFEGVFLGNGAGLTNLNASNLITGTVADARLTTNVALLNQNQKFTASNIFTGTNLFAGPDAFTGSNSFSGLGFYSGVNNFTNFGNSFYGSFFGNGLVGWFPVYAASTNASRDAGYVLLNTGLSTLTLPATSALSVGDIVRVSGGGPGGWLVKENSSQSITGTFATYRNAYLQQVATGDYSGVAAAADGLTIFASGNTFAGVYVSGNSGSSWSAAGSLSGYWSAVASSANRKIVYASPTSGTIQKSTDGGNTWSSAGTAATSGGISCTADGSSLFTGNLACSGNGTYRARLVSGVISYTTNSGGSWSGISTAPAATVACLAVSSDCTKMLAGVNNGLLYATANQGASWTTLTTSNQYWSTVWMSPDGSKIAGAANASGSIAGGIFYCNLSALPNTANTSSTVGGSQGSSLELQYIGNGQFVPVGCSGLLWSN